MTSTDIYLDFSKLDLRQQMSLAQTLPQTFATMLCQYVENRLPEVRALDLYCEQWEEEPFQISRKATRLVVNNPDRWYLDSSCSLRHYMAVVLLGMREYSKYFRWVDD